MALPDVPRRNDVLGDFGAERRRISHAWDVWLNGLKHRVDLSTPAGTFANNAAAVAAGIPVGQVYQTATGELRVVV